MAQGQKWEYLRAGVEKVIKEQKITPSDFQALGIHEDWHGIKENIYRTFCKLDHPSLRPLWLWEYFKLDTAYHAVEFPFTILERLIDPSEDVWFFINGDYDKFWFYQGKIRAIQLIIAETGGIDELYIVSKKYEWLLCINHHDTLIATGKMMADRLRFLAT